MDEGSQVSTAVSGTDLDAKLQFLYKALDDNQGVIRFLDAKAAFAVALLSAMAGKVLTDLPSYFPLSGQRAWLLTLLLCFWTLAALSGFLVFRVVFPVTNPAANLNLSQVSAKVEFFLWELKPRSWVRTFSRRPRFSKLAITQEQLLYQLKNATHESLLSCMTAEVMKVSYIRQIKADRLGALAWLLLFASISFVAVVTAESSVPKTPVPQAVRVEGTVEVHDKWNNQITLAPNPKRIERKKISPKGTQSTPR